MAVGQYALITLEDAKARMGLSDGDLQISGLTIYNDESDSATAATVQVTDTTIVLIVTDGGNAGTTTLTFADATDDTIAELVARINALDKGWVANAVCNGSADTDHLVIKEATSVFGSSNILTLEIVDNYLLEMLIDAATAIIERYCRRQFASRDYTSIYNGSGSSRLLLDQYPITRLKRLSHDLQSAIKIRNTLSTAVRATAEITDDGVELIMTNSSGDNTQSDAFASYTTITAMVDQINTHSAEGWEASVDNSCDNFPSTDLVRLPALYCLDEYAYLKIPKKAINDFQIYADEGRLHRDGGFNAGIRNVVVAYTAGYATIPDDLQDACLELVMYFYDLSKRDSTLQSEKIGNYSYVVDLQIGRATQILAGLSKMAQAVLETYRRIV